MKVNEENFHQIPSLWYIKVSMEGKWMNEHKKDEKKILSKKKVFALFPRFLQLNSSVSSFGGWIISLTKFSSLAFLIILRQFNVWIFYSANHSKRSVWQWQGRHNNKNEKKKPSHYRRSEWFERFSQVESHDSHRFVQYSTGYSSNLRRKVSSFQHVCVVLSCLQKLRAQLRTEKKLISLD